jgi:PAS domain S-box-containing protein
VLRHAGFGVSEAADGRRALAAIRAQRPDLVITDVLMPVMDGYDLVRAIRADPAIRDMPVIFHTAHYGEREARTLALASGVAAVLRKPSDAAFVVSLVTRVLAGQAEAAAADPGALSPSFDREHLRLVTDKLSEKADGLRRANARLRALINIGLELASERDLERLLQRVCISARDLFAATSVSVGILDGEARTVQRVVTCGAEGAGAVAGDSLSGILATVVGERRPMRGGRAGGADPPGQLPPFHDVIESYLAAPVASAARVYGWMCLVGNEGRGFTDDDQQLVTALAGQVGRIYEVEHEIVERHRVEEDLRKERDRSQRYLDTAEVIMLALDLDGRVTLLNRKGCDLLGWSERELLGRSWIETCIPARLKAALDTTLHAVHGGDLSVTEHAVIDRSGGERMIEWRNTLLRGADGQPIGTLSSGADVTDRHEAIERLRQAEERMRFALEAAGVGVWDSDMRTGLVSFSRILEAQYGIAAGTFNGTLAAVFDSIHPDDRQSVRDSAERAARDGADFTVAYRAVWPDGSVRWMTGAGRILLGEDGVPVRAIGIAQDVTERHLLEQQFQQAHKLDAIGRLAGGIAHDFNNLLAIILGNCDLLLTTLEADTQPRLDVLAIRQAGASAAALTRQLLAFSRKQIIEPTVVDVNAVIEDMRQMFERLMGEDIRVVVSLAAGLAPITADRGQMEQVVMNLAVNARDAMPRGGIMTIETANVQLDAHYAHSHHGAVPGAYVMLSVTDSGAGMTADVQARLFEPFFTTKPAGEGTGLGLATVHGIVLRGGGTVEVYSEAGVGTSFKVYLRQCDHAELATAASPSAASRAGRETVLVVDDLAGLRELAKRVLTPLGYTVLQAATADEALRLFEQEPAIGLLLTDIVMPGASGTELAGWLSERRPALKILYMSGFAEQSMLQRGALGATVAFIHKPFTAERLAAKVRETLDAAAAGPPVLSAALDRPEGTPT